MKAFWLAAPVVPPRGLGGGGGGPAPPAKPATGSGAPAGAPSGGAAPQGSGLSGEVPVGAVWSLSGGSAVYGTVQKNAADLAANEINRSGFLRSAKLKLIVEDARSTREGGTA